MGFRKILVALDGYPASLGAFKKAVEIAKTYGAEVVALQVEEDVPLLPAEKMMEAHIDELVTSRPLDLAREYGRRAGIEIKVIKKVGEPVAGIILETAEDEGIDLIILGDSRKSGFEKLYLGSVSQSVMENAKCPVMVIKKGWMNISDLIELAKEVEKKPEEVIEEEKPVYDPQVIKENFKFSGTLFLILSVIYFFAATIASKPFKDIAAYEILGLPFAVWCGFFLVVAGIVLTRIYINRVGGEEV